MPRSVTLLPDEIFGAYRIIAVQTDAAYTRDRLYRVEALCFHQEMVRSHKVLTESRRVGRTQCSRCAMIPPDRSLLAVGDVIGPVTLLAVEAPLLRRVRWACCSKEEVMGVQRLYVLRHRAKYGHIPACRACTDAARGRGEQGVPAVQLLQSGILSAAVAWPRVGA
jgi:hypothetical protein